MPIPPGYLLPLVDENTKLLPAPTVEALRAALQGAIAGDGFEYHQSIPQATWVISLPNDLGRLPAVTLYNDAGEIVEADVFATSTVVTVQWFGPTTGRAVIN